MKCEYCLEVKNLTVRYGDVVAIKDVTFSLEKGKFYTIVGPNGGGKSTLVKTIVGIIDDYEGRITIFGKDRNEYLKEKLIGYVPQMSGVNRFPIRVIDVVLMGLFRERKFRFRREHYEKARKVLESLGMENFESRLIHELSGGQRQRVMIARALVSDPEILIMDEPTVGLDRDSQSKFYDLVRKIKDSGITVIVVTHDVGFVSEYSDGILCVNRKLVVHAEDISELPKRFFTKLYGYNVKTVIHDHEE